MALWLIRTGKHGEYEQKFIESNHVYLTWEELTHDLSKIASKADMRKLIEQTFPSAPKGKISNHLGQIWQFVREMKIGDWVVVPFKTKPAVCIAEITGDYNFNPDAPVPFKHSRSIKWIAKDIPRSIFDQDVLYALGGIQTVYKVEKNDAEKRIRLLAEREWKSSRTSAPAEISEHGEQAESVDLEQLAKDNIAKLLIQRFKGHGLARLVNALLKAQGYTTHLSPEGPDKGIDILAAPGPMGFGTPRLCVQVKSGDSPVDSPTLNQLIGSMQNVQAEQGLLVSWGGFKSSVDKEVPTQFFRVRMWDQDDLIRELLASYDKLDEDLRAELPLKRIWTTATQDEDD